MKYKRIAILFLSLLAIWQSLIWLGHLPSYILPSPYLVFTAALHNWLIITKASLVTLKETLLGFLFGASLGIFMAIIMISFQRVKNWLLPVIIISQAIPIFAIAPLIVVWFGYGINSKIITITLMLFFPITAAFFDGLRRTNPNWLQLAETMNASTWAQIRYIRIPAALPALASGLRIAAVFAPLGAIVSEWVGASEGLGLLMLTANARVQIDMLFAALFSVVCMALILFFSIDYLSKRLITWR